MIKCLTPYPETVLTGMLPAYEACVGPAYGDIYNLLTGRCQRFTSRTWGFGGPLVDAALFMLVLAEQRCYKPAIIAPMNDHWHFGQRLQDLFGRYWHDVSFMFDNQENATASISLIYNTDVRPKKGGWCMWIQRRKRLLYPKEG